MALNKAADFWSHHDNREKTTNTHIKMSNNTVSIENTASVIAEFSKVHFSYDKLQEKAEASLKALIASDKENKPALIKALRKELHEVHGVSRTKLSELLIACGYRERAATEKKKLVIDEAIILQIVELAESLASDNASVALRRAYNKVLKDAGKEEA